MTANAQFVSMPMRATLAPGRPPREFSFRTLTLRGGTSLAGARSLTLLLSLLTHGVLVAALIIVPLLMADVLPTPADAVHAFFVAPPPLAAPPPPPPPPPAGLRSAAKAPPVPRPTEPPKFVAPTEVPSELPPADEGFDLGIEGGVPGGVEGGVPGGVLGGIVGGLPLAPLPKPTPPPRVVRVGGQLVAPELVQKVTPEYPELARTARLAGVIILEAQVDTSGRVKSVRVLRGQPLLNDAAVDAVKQWRYRPLLLNGVPTEFILTVTVMFNLH